MSHDGAPGSDQPGSRCWSGLRLAGAGAPSPVGRLAWCCFWCYPWWVSWCSSTSPVAGIKRSDVLASKALSAVKGKGALGGDTNILIMGLDSRLDENGDPLPQAIYDALHAVASGRRDERQRADAVARARHGSKATEISIPATTTLSWPDAPTGSAWARSNRPTGWPSTRSRRSWPVKPDWTVPKAADGTRRRTQCADPTVSQFLGGVPIDHFVEVTLVAFYQIAEVVQPITVCVNADTQDTYSGADFHKGYQQIDASQALAFVRQRRTTPTLRSTSRTWTGSAASSLHRLTGLSAQAGKYLHRPCQDVQDRRGGQAEHRHRLGSERAALAQQASSLTGGNVTFYTFLSTTSAWTRSARMSTMSTCADPGHREPLAQPRAYPTATTAPVTSSPARLPHPRWS